MQEIVRPQLHIAVCDDEASDRQQIAELVNQTLLEEGLSCRITSYESGTGLLSAIQNGAQFRILLLDVMMNELDGMALAAPCGKKGIIRQSFSFPPTGKWPCGAMRWRRCVISPNPWTGSGCVRP